MGRLQEIQQGIRAKEAEVKEIFDRLGESDPGADDRTRLKTLYAEADELGREGADLKAEQEQRAKFYQRQGQTVEVPAGSVPVEQTHAMLKEGGRIVRNAAMRNPGKDLGTVVLEDPDFKAWLGGFKDRNISDRERIHSPKVDLKALITGASSTSAGAFVTDDVTGIVDPGTSRRPLTLRSLVTNGTTSSDTVTYVRQGAITNAAAPVAEATATSGSSGAKPESAFAFSVVSETVKTIAHWVPVTRRALGDYGQIRTMINSLLMYGLEEELEDQMVNGDGIGENFTGLNSTSNTGTQAWSTNMIETLRKARTKVRTEGRANPNGYLLNPIDWESLDLLKDNEARYYFGGPLAMGTPRLWGLPVVESEAQAVGVGWVADWNLAILWDREQANILISDSHSDFFIRNLVAMLAEMRAAFGIIRPAAFIEADLIA
jgi:HK97 family phage major capsid protein